MNSLPDTCTDTKLQGETPSRSAEPADAVSCMLTLWNSSPSPHPSNMTPSPQCNQTCSPPWVIHPRDRMKHATLRGTPTHDTPSTPPYNNVLGQWPILQTPPNRGPVPRRVLPPTAHHLTRTPIWPQKAAQKLAPRLVPSGGPNSGGQVGYPD